ncbi:MAG TPA: uL15m family ribosomal protein [Candidatus Nanoarchaeia archaeon]|nr:uL15m family ribosomal protein [Candidatus Nanoarchaeia archaeon]
MVTNKRKKVQKYRGHTTHGGGHRKKRRGWGSRGGKGNAGTGKRAGHHKNRSAKQGRVIGSTGFIPRRGKMVSKVINLAYFTSERLEKLTNAGKIKKDGNTYTIDLEKIGYTKLLSTGDLGGKVNFKNCQCSAKVEEKVKAAGGAVKTSKTEAIEE